MSVAIITGSGGLIGSEAARFWAEKGFDVVGVDNDMRRYFFGDEATTRPHQESLAKRFKNFSAENLDIRDAAAMDALLAKYGKDVAIVIHTAAQPSHDWAAREPFTDFHVNATGTLNMLEATRRHAPDAVFIFTSTNKVYGDTPNRLPLVEKETRWEIDASHPYYERGINESMSIDHSTHSLFGASKVAADVMVQEYGKYFGMKTGLIRGGCLTGPRHAGAELHGFLAYLMKCAMTGRPYHIFGYKGKQVRDNIHSHDLINAFWHFFQTPRCGEAYNMGGSRFSNCSMMEAIALCEEICGRKVNTEYSETNRVGDHIWWISDVSKFRSHYPDWNLTKDVPATLREIHAYNIEHGIGNA